MQEPNNYRFRYNAINPSLTGLSRPHTVLTNLIDHIKRTRPKKTLTDSLMGLIVEIRNSRSTANTKSIGLALQSYGRQLTAFKPTDLSKLLLEEKGRV